MTDSNFANIIFEEPVVADAFSGQGHDRSAKALADGILQITRRGAEAGKHGGAVGLEGAWGSGKTAVIGFAQNKLRKFTGEFEFHVFTFDMWTHQTDEFRRALLEEFINFLASPDFPFEIDVEEDRDKVRNRKTQTTKVTKRRYTLVGAALVLSLPLLPILYSWLQPTAFINLDKLTWVPQAAIVIAVAVALIVFVVIAGAQRDIRRGEKKAATDAGLAKPKGGFWRRFTLAASEVLTVSRNVQDGTTTQWIRDEDPTTVEFHTVFGDLLAKAQTSKRRVVFVLDNVDGLSPTSFRGPGRTCGRSSR